MGRWGFKGKCASFGGGRSIRAEPVVRVGECGTGKTHLATALCVAACRQRKRVRFTTAAGLINELVEAQHDNQLRRVLARWFRYELIVLDEVGYVPPAAITAIDPNLTQLETLMSMLLLNSNSEEPVNAGTREGVRPTRCGPCTDR